MEREDLLQKLDRRAREKGWRLLSWDNRYPPQIVLRKKIKFPWITLLVALLLVPFQGLGCVLIAFIFLDIIFQSLRAQTISVTPTKGSHQYYIPQAPQVEFWKSPLGVGLLVVLSLAVCFGMIWLLLLTIQELSVA